MKNAHALILILLFFIGCEDNRDIAIRSNSNINEVVTSDIRYYDFYYNLMSDTTVDSSSTWHLSIQRIGVPYNNTTYTMPCVMTGSNYLAEYTDIVFDSLDAVPETFMEDYYTDTLGNADPTVIQYGGSNVIIDYDMTIHKMSIKNPERVFVLHYLPAQVFYKLQFIEYNSGVVYFKYQLL